MNLIKYILTTLLFISGFTLDASSTKSIKISDFPDLNGLANFSHCKKIHDTLFILTNPKSGSHLLTYSVMKITERPMRGRLSPDDFLSSPDFFEPENIMNYPVDFNKPTTYWGHEYSKLQKLNRNRNKLIFILRDFKENLVSQVAVTKKLLPIQDYQEELDEIFKKEILTQGPIFKEFIYRLQTYDRWNPDYRYLVEFQDLVKSPENFVPQVMEFIEDDSEYQSFIDNYDTFKKELLARYRKRDNGTGSESNLKFFRQFISPETLYKVDEFIAKAYPTLWERYLQQFQEKDY